MLKKPGPEGVLRLRTPDIERMVRNVAAHPYRSLLDQKDAYEQVRVVTEHVERNAFNTPDGTFKH